MCSAQMRSRYGICCIAPSDLFDNQFFHSSAYFYQLKLNHFLLQKVTVFWNVAGCSLAVLIRRFGRAYCLRHQGDEV